MSGSPGSKRIGLAAISASPPRPNSLIASTDSGLASRVCKYVGNQVNGLAVGIISDRGKVGSKGFSSRIPPRPIRESPASVAVSIASIVASNALDIGPGGAAGVCKLSNTR